MSTSKRDIPSSYEDADKFLGKRMERRIGSIGKLFRWSGVPGDVIVLRLHNTNIVTWGADGSIGLNHGGWTTITTMSWINRALAGTGFRVYRHRGTTWITKFEGVAKRLLFNRPRILKPHPGIDWIGDEKEE